MGLALAAVVLPHSGPLRLTGAKDVLHMHPAVQNMGIVMVGRSGRRRQGSEIAMERVMGWNFLLMCWKLNIKRSLLGDW